MNVVLERSSIATKRVWNGSRLYDIGVVRVMCTKSNTASQISCAAPRSTSGPPQYQYGVRPRRTRIQRLGTHLMQVPSIADDEAVVGSLGILARPHRRLITSQNLRPPLCRDLKTL